MPKAEDLLRVRLRLRDDFPYYAENALKIRTKSGTIEPLRLNAAQQILQDTIDRQIAETGRVRVIILKGRQQGLSTVIGGRIYFRVSQHKAKKAMVLTHHADSTRALFDMTKRYHDNVPEILKPSTSYSSRKELKFDILDSAYTVGTAGSESVGRGETLSHIHASEMGFWSKVTAKDIWNGLEQAVPNAPDTEIYIESTGNGVTGLFHELWKGAVAGENGFIPVFIPWFLTPEYREEPPATFQRSPEEEKLAKTFGLDDSQLYWRRLKVNRNGVDLFRQEYPCTPDEAFLTTGRPVFNPEQLTERLEELKAEEPMARKALEGESWEDHPRGEHVIYRAYDPAETYYIGADVAMGYRGGDPSVAQVLDSHRRQVATYRSLVHPDYFATVLYHLGLFWNTAKIAVESNNHGILTCTRLGKDLAYPNFFQETVYDKVTDQETVKLGFSVNVKSKPLIIDKLRADMREREIELNDPVTLREMLTFIVTDEGKMEAEPGCHDDTVMSLAIANHINEGFFQPITNTDDWYVEVV